MMLKKYFNPVIQLLINYTFQTRKACEYIRYKINWMTITNCVSNGFVVERMLFTTENLTPPLMYILFNDKLLEQF